MRLKITAAVGLSALLLVPATASAGSGYIPPVQSQVSPCAHVKAQYRTTIQGAKEARHQALQAANVQWRSATADERAALSAGGHSKAARKVFKRDTADERQARASAKRAARTQFTITMRSAKSERRAGLASCR